MRGRKGGGKESEGKRKKRIEGGEERNREGMEESE